MDESPSEIEHLNRAEVLKMWRAIVGYSGSREVADDAVAEAFARALHHGARIRDLQAWIWRVAFRVAASELQRRGEPAEQALQEAQVLQEQGPTPETLDLVAALRRLPEKQRGALVLHDYADRPTPEVAAIIGCSVPTVYVHLTRGRRRLRELLEVHDA